MFTDRSENVLFASQRSALTVLRHRGDLERSGTRSLQTIIRAMLVRTGIERETISEPELKGPTKVANQSSDGSYEPSSDQTARVWNRM